MSGQFIIGYDIANLPSTTTNETLDDILRSGIGGEGSDPLDTIQGTEPFRSIGLDGFMAHNCYAEEEIDVPIFIGMKLIECGNRGEPIVDACSIQVIEDARDTVERALQSNGFEGPIEVAFLLGLS